MVNICKLLINAVNHKEPKMLTGSNPKGKWLDISVNVGNTRTIRPSANRQDLNHPFVSHAEHGKPVSPPLKGKVNRKGRRWGCRQRRAEKANAILQWDG